MCDSDAAMNASESSGHGLRLGCACVVSGSDEAVNLNFRFEKLDPGASVTFTWAYILRTADLVTAMAVLDLVTVVQPTTTVSGSAVAFSAAVTTAVDVAVFTVSNATMVRAQQCKLIFDSSNA